MSLLDIEDGGDTVHHLAEPADPILAQWARFRDRFAEAMDNDLHTVADVEQRLAQRRAFLIPGKDSAVVTEVHDYPGGAKAMHVTWAAGDLSGILELAPGIEALARMMGCDKMIVEGQRGWERLLKSAGYEFFSVTLSKDL